MNAIIILPGDVPNGVDTGELITGMITNVNQDGHITETETVVYVSKDYFKKRWVLFCAILA